MDGFQESVRDSKVCRIRVTVEGNEVGSEVEEVLMNEGVLEPAKSDDGFGILQRKAMNKSVRHRGKVWREEGRELNSTDPLPPFSSSYFDRSQASVSFSQTSRLFPILYQFHRSLHSP